MGGELVDSWETLIPSDGQATKHGMLRADFLDGPPEIFFGQISYLRMWKGTTLPDTAVMELYDHRLGCQPGASAVSCR